MKYDKFIAPIFVHMQIEDNRVRDSFVGNGFYIDNYFITAAHVIVNNQNVNAQSNPFIIIDGKEIELTKERADLWKSLRSNENGNPIEHENSDLGDVAIFRYPGVKSELVLSKNLPKYGETLQCYFLHTEKPKAGIQYTTKVIGSISLYDWETSGQVHEKDGFLGNFYGATMQPEHPTGGGSSGSPLMKGNVVYGILHAGDPLDKDENLFHPEICVFFAASAALQLLR